MYQGLEENRGKTSITGDTTHDRRLSDAQLTKVRQKCVTGEAREGLTVQESGTEVRRC